MKQTYLFCLLFVSFFSNAQIINFTDANFKARLLEANPNRLIASTQTPGIYGSVTTYYTIDTNGDGEIQVSEAAAIRYLDVSSFSLSTQQNISNLDEISNFINLESLDCGYNQISTLDISQNNLLRLCRVRNNLLTSIDISQNSNLTIFDCSFNPITSLNLLSNTNLSTIQCEFNQLTNLDISQNINLNALHCSNSQITNLDTSQNINLTELYCNNNQLTNLNLSQNTNLAMLYCNDNLLTTLNINGTSNLLGLECKNNNLSNLNVASSIGLASLNCNNNQLNTLDLTNNPNLQDLFCDSNQFSNLDVSNNLILFHLTCSSNLLNTINLSNNTNLTIVDLSSNYLTSIDLTNQTNLVYFSINNNQLSTINLSNNINLTNVNLSSNYLMSIDLTNQSNLVYFSINNNQLSTINLSNIPNLTNLSCNYNQLTTLNLSNNSSLQILDCSNNPLQSLFIKNNSIEAFYDYTNNSQLDIFNFSNLPNLQYICADELQVNDIQNKITEYGYTNCNVNSYCSFIPGGEFYTIQGQQKFDNENDNCDLTDDILPTFKYSITDGTTPGTIISDNTGSFSIPLQAGIYTVTPILENPSYFNVSQTNVVVDFPTEASPFTQDFCITPNGTHHDVEVSIIPTNPARPGFDASYKIIYKNKGNQLENGTINLQFNDDILDVVSSNPTFTTQTTNNLSFDYSNLNPFETGEISVAFNVNSPMETPAVNSGDVLNYTVTNTITNTDEMLTDNTFVLIQTVVNSYDPNDKTCLEGNYISPDKIGEFVHYVIRFENTGTFPAENIVVKDMIDNTKFDVSSLIPLNASHNYFTKIAGNKVEFIFENINLPFNDATNDGYVAFKIKTLPSLVVGNTFSNSANIYFDYNFPIITNTATTTIAALNNPSFEFANHFSLYPNPTTNELNINLKSAIEINSIQIYNTIGQLVTVQTGNALKVDVSNLKSGNYFIKINTNEGFSTSQFIKE